MELGCSTILYGGHSLDEALDGIQQAGYKAIELCAIPGMAPHFEAGRDGPYYAEIKQKVADHGLVIESIGGSGNFKAEDTSQFAALLQAAAKVGAPAVTTGSGGQSDVEETVVQVLAALNEVTAVARDVGVKISIKPHVRAAIYDSKTALRMRSETDNEWVGVNFDWTHIFRVGEDPVEALTKLRDHVFTLRIRDTESQELGIGSVEGQVAPNGIMDLEPLCEAARQTPVPYATLEIVGTKQSSLEEVQSVVQRSYDWFHPRIAG